VPTWSAAAPCVQAYESVRPLSAQERELLPAMLRAGASVSGFPACGTWHLPREASMLKPHDPTHFERVLQQRIAHPLTLDTLMNPETQTA